jgi:hypothetical protein
MIKRTLRTVFGNFRLKAWALVIALCVWWYASSRMTEEVTVRMTLDIKPPSGYTLIHQDEQAARVTVAGPRSLLARVRSDLTQGFVKLSYTMAKQDLFAGQGTLAITPDWLRPHLPEGDFVQLRFRNISPPQVNVVASPVRERVLPVRPRTTVETAPGYRLAERASSSPAQVSVRGPALAVDAMDAVQTAELALYDVQADVHRPVSLRSEEEITLQSGERIAVPLEVEPASVILNVYVSGEEERQETFEGVPVLLLSPPGFPYEAELGEPDLKVTIRIAAPPAQLRRLRRESVQAFVDLAGLARERIELGASAPYKEPVRVLLPPDVTCSMVRAEPARVTLVLKNPAD